jgi:heat shock protein HslJ
VADGLPAPFVEGDVLRLTLGEDTLSFQATCNIFSGNLEREGDVLHVTNLGGTEMGCPGAGHEQDEWLVDFFSGGPTATMDGTDLALRKGDVEIWFVPESEAGVSAEPEVPLEGTQWTLTGIEEADGDSIGMMTIPPMVDAGVAIDEERLVVRTGCNRGSAEVTVHDDWLELGPLALTRRACTGAADEVERGVVRVLDGPEVDWSIRGTQLRLSQGDHALIYQAK